MTTRRAAIVTTAVLALLLTGCADGTDSGGGDGASPTTTSATATPTAEPAADPTVPTVAETVFPGAPEGVTGEDVAVVAGDDPRHLQVVTTGSSTCPVVPTEVTWDADASVLRISLTQPGDETRPCTMDLVPTTSVVALPDDAPDASALTAVEVDGAPVTVG